MKFFLIFNHIVLLFNLILKINKNIKFLKKPYFQKKQNKNRNLC